LALNTTII